MSRDLKEKVELIRRKLLGTQKSNHSHTVLSPQAKKSFELPPLNGIIHSDQFRSTRASTGTKLVNSPKSTLNREKSPEFKKLSADDHAQRLKRLYNIA
jgi:hypothetical protein